MPSSNALLQLFPWNRINLKHSSPTNGQFRIFSNNVAISNQETKFTITENEKRNEETSRATVAIVLPSSKDELALLSNFGSNSPVQRPTIENTAEHLQKKLYFFSEERVETNIFYIDANLLQQEELINADVVIAMYITSQKDLESLSTLWEMRKESFKKEKQCSFLLKCASSNNLENLIGPYSSSSPSSLDSASSQLPWTKTASAMRLSETMMKLISRFTSDDFTIAILLFIQQFTSVTIPWVQYSIDATWEKGPIQNTIEFTSMITKCGPCILKCLSNETCKKCLDELNTLDTRDQVASYRTIVSFESELLRDFSFCILQKNNIFQCEASIPKVPYVTPIQTWRGNAVNNWDIAKTLLIGNLNYLNQASVYGGRNNEFSWKVAAGANVAYDQFPCQFQLFYPDPNGKNMWYDPVFRVNTLDGRNVWCKRHYRVRNGDEIGTFKLSVLDNGVTSNEYWTIVGAADDLSWIVFHYAGAASAVGQKYLGGLLCTADGAIPTSNETREEIWALFQSAGIEPWELFVVDNDMNSKDSINAGSPPLDFYRQKYI